RLLAPDVGTHDHAERLIDCTARGVGKGEFELGLGGWIADRIRAVRRRGPRGNPVRCCRSLGLRVGHLSDRGENEEASEYDARESAWHVLLLFVGPGTTHATLVEGFAGNGAIPSRSLTGKDRKKETIDEKSSPSRHRCVRR